MEKVKTYIQQLAFDGLNYTKGNVVDILTSFGIICQEIPFKYKPEAKELPKRDWAGYHGADVFTPDGGLPIKDYTLDVEFMYVGKDDYKAEASDERKIRADIKAFIDFLYGYAKAPGQSGDVQTGRLAIYNERTAIGRKDVTVKKVDPKLFLCDPWDDECLARFSATFDINDPVTDVTPVEVQQTGVVTDLTWSV